ncbi:MAG: DUF177 domain-containing protein [Aureispira sp.]|nr:DUF177 domain-containing protein [Aureispira sp.]
MKKFKVYSINISSLSDGDHLFDYQIDNKFFEEFEKSLIKDSNISAKVTLSKYPNLLNLSLQVSGTVQTACDICAEALDLEIKGEENLVVKFVEEIPETDNPEVLYLDFDASFLNVAELLYELITLSIPIRKVHPIDENSNYTCNPIALQYLTTSGSAEDQIESEEESRSNNPMWDALQKLKDNNKN